MGSAPSPLCRRILPRALSVAAAILLGGCGERVGDAPTLEVEVVEIPAPVGDGSMAPALAPSADGPLLTWLEPRGGEVWDFRMARLGDGGWEEPRTVAEGEDFFVNWADVPAVVEVGGVLRAHWLVRGPAGGYDYGIRVARSEDGGRTWSEPWIPHGDATPTEHGFVSTFPVPGGSAGMVWLDGRAFVDSGAGPATEEMALRFRGLDGDGPGAAGPEEVLDARACDCCPTDVAVTDEGPVVVYRDRSEAEIRDIHRIRWTDGGWSGSLPVHRDGWRIAACPVNGPAIDARERTVVVAWFTGADDVPAVKRAFSSDAGATFADPARVDDGDPVGRADVVLLEDGSALVAWIESTVGGGAEIRARRVWADGRTTASATLRATDGSRGSGFPRLLGRGDELLLAWTDVEGEGRVRTARVRLVP